MNKKLLAKITVGLLSFASAFGFERLSTNELLISYLENDTELKNLTIKAKKAELSLDKTEIENGFDISLSTGEVTLKTSSDGVNFSVKPNVTAKIPQANNLEITGKATLDGGNSEDTAFSTTDAGISLSVDIISSTALKQKITLLKAERTVTEAKRALENQALTAEKEFYTSLKEILNSTADLISKQSDLYEDTISFEKIKAQGYTASSSSYRLAQMKVQKDKYDIESDFHSLCHDYIVFYKKCGYDIQIDDETNFFELIPDDIPIVEAQNIDNFEPDSYTETEAALWNHKINAMERESEKFFSLAATGGFTFKNSNTSSNTVDAGVTATIGGTSLSAGVNIPIATKDEGTGPAFTFSAAVSPNTFKKNEITKQQNELDEEAENLAIATSRQNFGTAAVSQRQNLKDIQWSKETNESNYQIYSKMEEDMESWYKQGFITESEYLSAQTNARNYKVQLLIDDINLIIYNNEIQLMFVK